ncbi:MAG: N-acetylneuraminate synthase family protein [Gammaproteobacteria bacterium]
MKEHIKDAVGTKSGEDILIVGKGPSVDTIDFSAVGNMIVINVNDSELVYPGDIAVFHHGWVLDVFDEQPPRCKLYFSDKQVPGDVRQVKAEYIPNTPESASFILHRFFNKPLVIEQAVLITALRVANEIARLEKLVKNVYLVGFDFTTRRGFTTKIPSASQHSEPEFSERVISSQEQLLGMLIAEKERLSINIKHVGDKTYSFYSTNAFNSVMTQKSGTLRSSFVSEKPPEPPDYKVQVTAEITTNHFGDIDRLKSMIRAAKDAGADLIKLQKRNVDTFYTREQLETEYKSPFGSTFRDYRHGIELGKAHFDVVAELCRELDIGWFVSVLDLRSYEFIKQYDLELIKLPSTMSEDKNLLTAVASDFKKDIVISTGYTDENYEEFILDNFSEARKLYLLQCMSLYPTMEDKAHVGVVRHYYDLSRTESYRHIVPGYSSHDIGSLCSMMAVAAGARMIEKHVKFGDVCWSHFDEVAIDLVNGEFARFVADIRRAERIVGNENKRIHKEEHHKYWQATSG